MKWSITEMLVTNDVVPEMVTRCGFSVSDTQDNLSAQINNALNIGPANPDNYTPYPQVTELQAIGWVQEVLGVEGTESIEAQVQAIIDKQKIPLPQPAPLPWVAE
jgi:hypothetical protein